MLVRSVGTPEYIVIQRSSSVRNFAEVFPSLSEHCESAKESSEDGAVNACTGTEGIWFDAC